MPVDTGAIADAIAATQGALPASFDATAVASSLTEETLQLVARARQADLTRGINLATGLIGYDLATPAQVVQPVFTPFLNSLPRFAGVGVDVHRFKSITAFGWDVMNGGIPGVVDESAAPVEPSYTVASLFNEFQTIGVGNSVSFKSIWRGRSLDGDILAKRTAELIFILKLVEEQWLTYYSDYLWTLPVPLAPSAVAAGGTIAAGTYYVGVTAKSANGETLLSSSPTPIVTTGSTSKISLTFFTEPLASSYEVYVSTDNATWWQQPAANFSVPSAAKPTQTKPNLSGNMSCTLTAVTLSAVPHPPAAHAAIVSKGGDNNPLTFNGLLAMIFGAGNAVYSAPNAAPSSAFSAAGAAGFSNLDTTRLGTNTMNPQVLQPAATTGKLAYTDLEALLLAMFHNSRANPDVIAVSPQDNQTLTNILVNAAGVRFVVSQTPDAVGNIIMGQRVTQMLNPTTGKVIQIEVWPFLPQGTLLAISRSLPYPVPGFDGPICRIITNREYWALDYPPIQSAPKYAFADYVDETLQLNFLGGFGAITGIIPG